METEPIKVVYPEVPHLDPVTDKQHFLDVETLGLSHMHQVFFVLVAGGLGERLNSVDIKISLIYELVTRKMFIELYCEHIKQLQERAGCILPLVIMTSDDTD